MGTKQKSMKPEQKTERRCAYCGEINGERGYKYHLACSAEIERKRSTSNKPDIRSARAYAEIFLGSSHKERRRTSR